MYTRNRQIKFRGKNEQGWHYGLLTYMFGSYAISHVEDENTVDLIDAGTVSQYSGIQDLNDVEIYEGAIVSTTWRGWDRNFEIMWDNDKCRFMVWDGINPSLSFELTCDSVIDYQIKVIGNIYENVGLLKN